MSWLNALSPLGQLSHNELLAKHTTLAIGGAARWYFKPNSKTCLAQAMALIPEQIQLLPLGRGSNLLISDHGFNGIIIDLAKINHINIQHTELHAEAGARMSKVAQQAASHALSGLECMATVPGDLGGGVAMNAGAFGQQLSDCLSSIEIILRNGSEQCLTRDKLDMSYRYTSLPKGSVVTSARFALTTTDTESIRQRMREMRQQRSLSQPLALPNCGSVFKNPIGDHAARLIEASGLKGKQIGQAQISELHANFIVNHGQAKADDIMALIKLAQSEVQRQFGIKLEPEVCMIGSIQ
ncbi:MAG: UDP-N-acetylmuramate dehydrogenase [Mariprofundaceae bacterium]